MMTRDVWLITLGAILAFGGGLVAFFIQWWWNRTKQRETFHRLLSEILLAFKRICPRLIEMYDKSGILWNDLLGQISSDLALYERNREHSVILKDPKFRAEVWDWFSKLRTAITMCTALNNAINLPQVVNDPVLMNWTKDQLKKQVEHIKDLKNEVDKLLQGLSD